MIAMVHVWQPVSFQGSSVNATGVQKEGFDASQVLLRGVSLTSALTGFDLLYLDLKADDWSEGNQGACVRHDRHAVVLMRPWFSGKSL